jgi:hypothetical protein
MFWRAPNSPSELRSAVHRATDLARAFLLLEDELESRVPVGERAPHPRRLSPRPTRAVERRPGAGLPRPQYCISPVARPRACMPASPARAGR